MIAWRRRSRASGSSWQQAPDVSATGQGDRTVLLDWRRGRYFGLDEVGGRIWELFDAGATPAAIAERLAEEYDAPPEVLAADVEAFVARLRAARLLARA